MPYAQTQDIRLFVRQSGVGPVALFIHGFPLDSTMWLDQVEALAGTRRCIAPDLRGFGRSEPITGSILTMEQHASDLMGVLDLVSVEQADIVGLSMGGYVALAIAELYPDRVRSLALVDTRAGSDSGEARAGRDLMADRLLNEGRRAIADTLLPSLMGPEADRTARARVRTMIEECRYETIVGALAGMRDRPDRTALLPKITVPTAVIVGADDVVTPPAEAEAMAEMLPQCNLTLIPSAGHMAPIEQPAAVNQALRDGFTRSMH